MKANVYQKNKQVIFNDQPDRYKRERSMFDKSHDVRTTFSMGQLVPFLTEETLPGDTWEVSNEILVRFAPLYLPIMTRCEITLDYFYCPNRIIWPSPSGWAEFISQKEVLEAPYVSQWVQPNGGGINEDYPIAEYMGFPTSLVTDVLYLTNYNISALPISAYLKIYDEYYRNPQLQEEKWFPLTAGNNTTGFIPGGTDFTRLRVLRKLWNRDYFTSALPTPQIGEDVLIPMFNDDFSADGGAFNPDGPFRWRLEDTGGIPTPGPLEVTSGTVGLEGQTTADGDPVYLDIQETAATIRTFRFQARLLEFYEQIMRIGQRYRGYIWGKWGEDPDAGTVDVPIHIGRSKGVVVISEVLATAETLQDDTVITPLGSYAGQALAIESSPKFKYHCKEHGFIIGIVSITPRSSYFQGMHKMWDQRLTPLDYADDHFALIGDQAILKKELRWNPEIDAGSVAYNLETFGYIPRYSEYRWSSDIASGQMRTIWKDWHLSRLFNEGDLVAAELNGFFVTCIPRVSDVFQIQETQDHEIFAHIYNKVEVWRQLPKYGIPRL